jgi:hypothetical protein
MLSTVLIACIAACLGLAAGFFGGLVFGVGVWQAANRKSDTETARMVADLKAGQERQQGTLGKVLAHSRNIALEISGSWGDDDDE